MKMWPSFPKDLVSYVVCSLRHDAPKIELYSTKGNIIIHIRSQNDPILPHSFTPITQCTSCNARDRRQTRKKKVFETLSLSPSTQTSSVYCESSSFSFVYTNYPTRIYTPEVSATIAHKSKKEAQRLSKIGGRKHNISFILSQPQNVLIS